MSAGPASLRVALIERPHPPGHRGALSEKLAPALGERNARVEVVHAEVGLHRLDSAPPWDLVVLKSGSAAALHLAASAEGWGVASVNTSEATRLAQDKLASALILRRAGLPVAHSWLAWLGPGALRPRAMARWSAVEGRGPTLMYEYPEAAERLGENLEALSGRSLIVKAARGSQGVGLWTVEPGELASLAQDLPEGPYLIMDRVPHAGDDLKVYVAGGWMSAIKRPFPAKTYAAKLGRPASVPPEVASAAREAGRLLGLSCYGCDFVRGPEAWVLVDVNAFPGYKGAVGAPGALADEVLRVADILG